MRLFEINGGVIIFQHKYLEVDWQAHRKIGDKLALALCVYEIDYPKFIHKQRMDQSTIMRLRPCFNIRTLKLMSKPND